MKTHMMDKIVDGLLADIKGFNEIVLSLTIHDDTMDKKED